MIRFPKTALEAASLPGEVRAGGTDVQERLRTGRARSELVDLRDAADMAGVEVRDGQVRIGARTTIAAVADGPGVPLGVRLAAAALATPQIRAVGTLGGNLLQHVRCWYYRNPEMKCWRAGGEQCLAREGDHLYHNCFDTTLCAAPHPSTLGCALLAYEAEAWTADERTLPMAALLAGTERPLVAAVRMADPPAGERASYFRAIARARAEWPLVEVSVRLRLEAGLVTFARVVVGGVAATPLRREEVERRLVGKAPDVALLAEASAAAADGARPLPMTAYKVDLLPGAVREALERALASR